MTRVVPSSSSRRRPNPVQQQRVASFLLVVVSCLGRTRAAAAFFGSTGSAKIPRSDGERNRQAVDAIRKAISSPRVPSVPYVECEFPALAQLNKLGDGSLRSSNQVDDANLEFARRLFNQLNPPLPFLGPRPWLLTSTAASQTFTEKAYAKLDQNPNVRSLKDGIPSAMTGRDVCVIVSPSSSRDYKYAKELALERGNTVVVVNGSAKDPSSVPAGATMAYYCKPLTYNSRIGGYLLRRYPDPWTALDASGNALGASTDAEILVGGTNTPDLRASVRLVQQAVDRAAIEARRK